MNNLVNEMLTILGINIEADLKKMIQEEQYNQYYTINDIKVFKEISKEKLLIKLHGFPNNVSIADLVFTIKGLYCTF